MMDYRQPEKRHEYFDALYTMNLKHGVMPGLVYLYMPEMAKHFGWDDEDKLWFAFLNGMTQNPITSLRLFTQLPSVPPAGAGLNQFTDWFNGNWETLQFDTDRRYQKRDTIEAIKTYARLVEEHGTQKAMLTGKTYQELWNLVRNRYYSFGRLSSFSYLEYVYLNGFGSDCDDLLFGDKSGSKSHRNGMMFLLGQDQFIWDKRANNGFDGTYPNFPSLVGWLSGAANTYLKVYRAAHPTINNVGNFTLESNLCTFKNHFFGRRYPGVYADMAWERIVWAEAHNIDCRLFKDMRAGLLPDWLRAETENVQMTINQKAALFAATGYPYRGDNFL
jgi:hypothetical protein